MIENMNSNPATRDALAARRQAAPPAAAPAAPPAAPPAGAEPASTTA